MLKLVTVAEARQTQVNNLDENNCKVYGLFHSSKENHSTLFIKISQFWKRILFKYITVYYVFL